jgi:hypothetical protein
MRQPRAIGQKQPWAVLLTADNQPLMWFPAKCSTSDFCKIVPKKLFVRLASPVSALLVDAKATFGYLPNYAMLSAEAEFQVSKRPEGLSYQAL